MLEFQAVSFFPWDVSVFNVRIEVQEDFSV